MPLFADYAITPDVFAEPSHSCRCCYRMYRMDMKTIRQIAMDEGLVRNLHSGYWATSLAKGSKRAKELLKKMIRDGRLVECGDSSPAPPASRCAWCEEALLDHQGRTTGGGVITTTPVKRSVAYRRKRDVETIEMLGRAAWRQNHSHCIRLKRCIAAYRRELALVLRHARSLRFIDPYINPAERNYSQFGKLLQLASGRKPAPTIEIHRKFDDAYTTDRWRTVFKEALGPSGVWSAAGALNVRVYIWRNFHDRYLISNLVGISLAHGYDTGPGRTNWNRLTRTVSDDVQRDFAPDQNEPVDHFKVP